MSREKIYKMDDGSWLTSDKKEGVGRDKMNFDAPSWKGREQIFIVYNVNYLCCLMTLQMYV